MSKKRKIVLVAWILLVAAGLCACVMLFIPAQSSFSGRESWYWGVNGHHRGYASYPDAGLEQQLSLAAGLGSNIYRFNLNPRTEEDFAYLDRVLEGCAERGMDMLLVMDDRWTAEEDCYKLFYDVASRYNGKIKYIQVFNEVDVYSNYFGNGVETWQFRKDKLAEMLPKIKEGVRGIRDGAGDGIKIVMNYGWIHTGYLDILAENQIDYDVIGLDWYSNAQESLSDQFDFVLDRYPQDVIICEINEHPTVEDFSEDSQSEYIASSMREAYDYPSDRLLGYIVYELYDQPEFEVEKDYDQEAHFGLVALKDDFSIDHTKKAYSTMSRLVGGQTIMALPASITVTAATAILALVGFIVILRPGNRKKSDDKTGSVEKKED